MNKRKLLQRGKVLRIRPAPLPTGGKGEVGDSIRIDDWDEKRIFITHVQSNIAGEIHFDAISDYREPEFLMLKGQLEIIDGKIVVDPTFHPEKIAALAKKAGLGVYELPEPPEPRGDAARDEFRQILDILRGRRTDEAVARLKAKRYATLDKTNELQVILGLLSWFRPPDTSEMGVDLCRRGIQLVEELGLKEFRAFFISQRAIFLMWEFADRDLGATAQIKAGNLIGFHTMTEAQRLAIVANLEDLWRRIEADLHDALSLIKESRDVGLVSQVISNRVIALGIRASHNHSLGLPFSEFASAMKKAFEYGKQLLVAAKAEYLLGFLFHNVAIQLNSLGEFDEAMGLSQTAMVLAEKFSDEDLIENCRRLQAKIEQDRQRPRRRLSDF